MNNKYFFYIGIFFILFCFTACSLPPEVPVTRSKLLSTGLYRRFVIKESPEQLLNALNAQGDVVIEGQRRMGRNLYPVHIKLLATSGGIEIVDYDR